MIVDKCRLCGEVKELCHSHIVPEFCYKPLYDEKNRMYVLSTMERSSRRVEQKGVREFLLCKDCEGKRNVWETYSAKVLYGGTPITVRHNAKKFVVSNVDYEKLKLFELSVLWMCSLAVHPLFEKVKLGPHEEIIRERLFESDAGDFRDYGCVKFALLSNEGLLTDFINQAENIHIDGLRCVRMIFSGFMWLFFVGSHLPQKKIVAEFLQPTGVWSASYRRIEDLKDFGQFYAKAESMGRLPNDIVKKKNSVDFRYRSGRTT